MYFASHYQHERAYVEHGFDLADDLFGWYDSGTISSRDVTDDVIRRHQGGVELGVWVGDGIIVDVVPQPWALQHNATNAVQSRAVDHQSVHYYTRTHQQMR